TLNFGRVAAEGAVTVVKGFLGVSFGTLNLCRVAAEGATEGVFIRILSLKRTGAWAGSAEVAALILAGSAVVEVGGTEVAGATYSTPPIRMLVPALMAKVMMLPSPKSIVIG
ncbi:hypothetical protein L8N14_020240, partial [Serratia marcescens]|nr:hypothetical protein [Serratia marcescens]